MGTCESSTSSQQWSQSNPLSGPKSSRQLSAKSPLFSKTIVCKLDSGIEVKADTPFSVRYDKLQLIGTGGYSSVFMAMHRRTSTKVAVKEMKRANMSKEIVNNLRREVEILQSLNHPNIVQIVDFVESPEKFHLVLELLEGGELFARIVRKTVYTEKEARSLVNTLFVAIKYCHDNNVVHRDLKPENLLLTSAHDDADLKMIDFGFARRTSGMTLKTMCGSPGYIAPEILKKAYYGAPVDMWAAGVIVYTMIGGYPPFNASRNHPADRDPARAQADLFKSILKGAFFFHDKYWGSTSEEAKDLIRGLLEVDFTKRFTVTQALNHPWVNVYLTLYRHPLYAYGPCLFLEQLRVPDERLSRNSLDKPLENLRRLHLESQLQAHACVVPQIPMHAPGAASVHNPLAMRRLRSAPRSADSRDSPRTARPSDTNNSSPRDTPSLSFALSPTTTVVPTISSGNTTSRKSSNNSTVTASNQYSVTASLQSSITLPSSPAHTASDTSSEDGSEV